MHETTEQVKILELGAEGDGLAEAGGKTVYVPFTLPGEVADIAILPAAGRAKTAQRARLAALKTRSAERIAPQCRYFTACGGCALQHWQAEPYQAWKRQRIFTAFAQEGIALTERQVAALFPAAAGARRRLALSAKIEPNGEVLGFNRAMSHEIIAVEECPVAEAALVAALPVLRACLAKLKVRRAPFHLILTAAENGLDIALQGVEPPLAEEEKLRLSEFFMRGSAQSAAPVQARLLQLTSDGEIIVSRAEPIIRFGSALVNLPSGGFLQATAAAEEQMAQLAKRALKKCKNVADLFAGCGSFSFRLAEEANIHAVEWDKAALSALERGVAEAAKSGLPLKKITAERRDLFRRPLTARELASYDGLLFDPPRAGAEAQAQEIAKSAVRTVIAVSCNPATLARDAAILLAGGYRLENIAPLDQFLWSPHIEAVAIFSKRPAKKSWKL